jgi:predicted DNA binding CopG/RHH family protein
MVFHLFGTLEKQLPVSVMTMISNTIKERLTKNREMTSITLRIPVDVVESMKTIAPRKGLSGYQALLKAYVSEGLRHDEAQFLFSKEAKLIEALKRRGVSEQIIEEAVCEVA